MPPSRKPKSSPSQSSSTKRAGRPKKTKEIVQEDADDESLTTTATNDNTELNEPNRETSKKTAQKTSPAKRARPQKRTRVLSRRKGITEERLLNVIDQISTTIGDLSDKRLKLDDSESSSSSESSGEENERAVYSCKFCSKEFSSAFIHCLHLRIHEKVGSVSESKQQTSSTQNSDIGNSEISAQVKEEVIEEVTLSPDEIDIKEENIEYSEQDNEPKKEFIGMINKNFVENLKKNLSLAMNRQVN